MTYRAQDLCSTDPTRGNTCSTRTGIGHPQIVRLPPGNVIYKQHKQIIHIPTDYLNDADHQSAEACVGVIYYTYIYNIIYIYIPGAVREGISNFTGSTNCCCASTSISRTSPPPYDTRDNKPTPPLPQTLKPVLPLNLSSTAVSRGGQTT